MRVGSQGSSVSRRKAAGAWARLRRAEGVTAVKLVGALAVMALPVLASLPIVGMEMAQRRARDATEQVVTAVRLAREYAIGTRATYAVTITSTTIAVTCETGCPAHAPTEPTATVVNHARLSSAVNPLRFTRTGRATQDAQIVVHAAGVSDSRVCVSSDVPGRVVRTNPGETCPP
jgi:Tfp pilus assembly protein FimT